MKEIILHPVHGGQNGRYATVPDFVAPHQRKAFIEANTVEATFSEIRDYHIIPVFHKDNEPLISQVEFVEAAYDAVLHAFRAERVSNPILRVSHPIKGRVPEARNKPASELQDWEQTLYYERMAFLIEIPSILDNIGGEDVCLVVGGVKSYNLDNLSNRKGSDEHFKVFIGFKVSVCTNLCVWSDGLVSDLKVRNLTQLQQAIYQMISTYDAISAIRGIDRLTNYDLTESQFAHVIGRCRMYQHMPLHLRQGISELQFGDQQIGAVCKDYYRDQSFCRAENGDINLWRLYNLFTAANKQSYIDSFLERAAGASVFVTGLVDALEGKGKSWFLK
jgi:hypothetical protein